MPSINLGKVVGTVDENTPITFEDYTSTTAPEPEEALSKITSPNTIGNLFKYIKGFLSNVIHKNNITNSVDTNDSTKIPSSVVTYSLNETKVDKTSIGNLQDLSTTEKNSLVNAINEVFQLGNEKKEALVTNLIAMGVTCSISESWESLLAKVLDIVTGTDISDTTAIASHVLETDYFYNAQCVKTKGTMVDRSCVNGNELDILSPTYPRQTIHEYTVSASQYGKWGSNEDKEGLIVPAPSGYFNNFDGGDLSYVYVPVNSLRSELGITGDKILAGNTICGVEGTAVIGKQFASGSIYFNQLSELPKEQYFAYFCKDGTSKSAYFCTISLNLNFIPSMVVAKMLSANGYVYECAVAIPKVFNDKIRCCLTVYGITIDLDEWSQNMTIPVFYYDGISQYDHIDWIAYA